MAHLADYVPFFLGPQIDNFVDHLTVKEKATVAVRFTAVTEARIIPVAIAAARSDLGIPVD